ncbi:MAG: hypothetical protein M1608_11035 [Candidatus Omnitrophica bacterium]|nr:hypothetical protein [Candidatus Omnitrophota bacterium]
MNKFLNKLNLRPQELRLVVGVAAILFVFLNLWLVRPHFKDWRLARQSLAEAERTLATYQHETEPARIAGYQTTLKQLEGAGPTVLPTEQSLDLIRAIQSEAARNGVSLAGNNEVTTLNSMKTNEFFEEKARLITLFAGEKELVNFLVSLGSSNSLIRVRDMNLRPAPNQYQLQGRITLVASYQKSRPAGPTASSAPRVPVATRPYRPTPKR